MMSQPGKQKITIHILPIISRKATRQWNLVRHKNHTKNETGRLIPDSFLFFKKALYEVKTSVMEVSFNIFR